MQIYILDRWLARSSHVICWWGPVTGGCSCGRCKFQLPRPLDASMNDVGDKLALAEAKQGVVGRDVVFGVVKWDPDLWPKSYIVFINIYIYITIYIEIIRLVYNYNSSWLMPTHFGLPSPVLVGSAGLSQAIDLQSLAHKTAHEQPPKHAMTTLVKRGGWFLEMGQNPQKR